MQGRVCVLLPAGAKPHWLFIHSIMYNANPCELRDYNNQAELSAEGIRQWEGRGFVTMGSKIVLADHARQTGEPGKGQGSPHIAVTLPSG